MRGNVFLVITASYTVLVAAHLTFHTNFAGVIMSVVGVACALPFWLQHNKKSACVLSVFQR
jgi:hypothetical protein